MRSAPLLTPTGRTTIGQQTGQQLIEVGTPTRRIHPTDRSPGCFTPTRCSRGPSPCRAFAPC